MKKLPSKMIRRQPGEPAREGVLRILKLCGEATARELSREMKITYTAVRRHLSQLQEQGLISASAQQSSIGRPFFKYCLTDKATEHFPTGYENMAANLLDTIFSQSGHTAVMDYLRQNNNYLGQMLLPRFAGKNLAQKVEELALYYNDNGYMTGWKSLPEGNFFLYHQNCAIFKLAVRYRQLCILEPRLMEYLLGVKVTRQQYILKNQPICGYFIDSKRPLA